MLRDFTGALQSQIPRSIMRQLSQYPDSGPGKVKMLAYWIGADRVNKGHG